MNSGEGSKTYRNVPVAADRIGFALKSGISMFLSR